MSIQFRKKMFEEAKAQLEEKCAKLRVEIDFDPRFEVIKCNTSRLVDLLDRYKGKKRFTPEFTKEFDGLHTEAQLWEVKAEERKRSGKTSTDFITELVETESELRDIISQLYYLNRQGEMGQI